MSLGFEDKWLENYLRDFERDDTIEIMSSSCEPAVASGDNYLSTITRLRVKIRRNGQLEETRSLIVKNLPGSDLAKRVDRLVSAFKKEIIVRNTTQAREKSNALIQQTYRDILKKFEGLETIANRTTGSVWCRMVAHRSYDLLILEDLKAEGFETPDRKTPLGVTQGHLVMKGFGLLHACGAIELKNGTIDTELLSEYFFSNRLVINSVYKKVIHVISKAIKQTWGPEWYDLGNRVAECNNTLESTVLDLFTNYNSKYNVVNHGDLWIPNIMFKRDEATGQPESVKFLDFQFSHRNSFAWDVSLFLFGAMDPSIRRKHWLELLKTYYSSLEANMASGGMPAHEIPSFEEVLQELERIKFMRLLILGLQFALSISNEGDYEFEKVFGEPENLDRGVNLSMFGENFKNYVLDDLKELYFRL